MSTGFLVTTITGKLKYINDLVNQHFLNKLYIYVTVNKNQQNLRNNEWVSRKIVEMYSSSASLFPKLDVRIILNELKLPHERVSEIKDFNADVFILPRDYDRKKICSIGNLKEKLCVLYTDDEVVQEADNIKFTQMKTYQNVVLGGTFDRLHNGHKILLSEALLRCSKKITVGVTDENMIKGKKLSELIEPCAKRVQAVELFIKEVDDSVDCEVVVISDMYGPTKSDPDMNMIVVSSETCKGALKVNELRKKSQLNELAVHVVTLVEDSESCDVEEKKISSSNARIRLLGTYIRSPQPKPDLPLKPYIIGLTGGVGSGKSSICEYLSTLGAGVVDCDKVAHKLYKPKTDIYYKLIQLFGKNILSENKDINRKELGAIVFKDPKKLQILNELLWPAIYKAAVAECERLYNEELKEIVFLEAAVLLRANWQEKIHEVWSTIIPEDEAINRLMKRNNFTEEEAKLRINAQPSNSELVEISNVVFCSLWSVEFTRNQVNKAWTSLQLFLSETRS